MNECANDVPTLTELVDSADDELFAKVLGFFIMFCVTLCKMKQYRLMDSDRGAITKNLQIKLLA